MQKSIYDDRTEAVILSADQMSRLVAKVRKALKELGYQMRKRNQRPEWQIIAPSKKWALLVYSPGDGWHVEGPADTSDKLTISSTIQRFVAAVENYEARSRQSRQLRAN
ncbi:hypothetical protein H6F46_18145 [Limnothrix sp. FACHB-1083]|uniref:hypothetical protein n=1 Tax=unclassified Limnothrix TaxID=2632864 RepID=UPI0016817CA7|nr:MULTISPECIES: hypothetical protein [unclassified Limnothrix]MBD2162613.1 hypothetical protein [Limnothrix sp. FACHB-1083]MBD2193719.1 hypothetical protein [Limnothrix sp. FACHB-1088]